MKEFKITKDEDSITSLINNKEFCLNLILLPESEFSISDINLNQCEIVEGDFIDGRIGVITLDYLLDYFYENFNLDVGKKLLCGNCKNSGYITKNYSLYYTPKILIIFLKRFRFINNDSYYKNNILIRYPLENLDLGKYIYGPDKEYSQYDLFAVNQHYGGYDGGHYISICKNIDGNWYRYDDSSVCKISELKVDEAAFILFYRKKTW